MAWNTTRFVKNTYHNVNLIFPLKQAAVGDLVDYCKDNVPEASIIIFGSAVESRCNPWSDIDAFISGAVQDDFKMFRPNNGESYDLWFDSMIPEGEEIMKDILHKGVKVYG